MENEEKIMTDQDIIQEKTPNSEQPSRTLQATQMVDADQEVNVDAESHDSLPLDAGLGADAEHVNQPHASQAGYQVLFC
jgi:hypothetical protein